MKAPLIPDLRDPVSKDLNSSTFLQPAGSFQGGKGKLRRLPYRIIYASSEDEGYAISELSSGRGSIGWQSARFCEFPQIIVLQLPFIVSLRQIQLLSHQSKISSRIQLFTYVPDQTVRNRQIPLHQIAWKRLGKLQLEDNSRSNYSS